MKLLTGVVCGLRVSDSARVSTCPNGERLCLSCCLNQADTAVWTPSHIDHVDARNQTTHYNHAKCERLLTVNVVSNGGFADGQCQSRDQRTFIPAAIKVSYQLRTIESNGCKRLGKQALIHSEHFRDPQFRRSRKIVVTDSWSFDGPCQQKSLTQCNNYLTHNNDV